MTGCLVFLLFPHVPVPFIDGGPVATIVPVYQFTCPLAALPYRMMSVPLAPWKIHHIFPLVSVGLPASLSSHVLPLLSLGTPASMVPTCQEASRPIPYKFFL